MNPTAISTFALVLALGAIGVASGAQAAVLTGSLSGWETTVGTWGETTNLGAADGTSITGFTTVDGVLVSVNDQVHSIGDGWATWSGGYTGQVLADYSSLSVSYTLGSGVKGFGMFIEPDPFSVIDITLTTSDGSTLTQAVNGNGGAEFFGWTGGGITSFTVTSTSDFAVGDFFSARVPEPATWAMMLLGIGGLGAVARASRKRASLTAS